MFEESSMDKKSNNAGRSGSGPSKAQGSDSKAKQDVVSNKFRKGRRRETCPRPEPARKPTPQRFKGVDKRPKVAVTSRAEVGSALQQGSKKLNWNHLLNFTCAPRESVSQISPVSHSDTKKHKYNKEQFLQANCQFIVRSGGDYAIHSVDPDLLVDWDAIELVRLPSHEIPSCPICLSQPVASKIARCGHVYCWACILHDLVLPDETWCKCPICCEAVHKKDLKSVVSLSTHTYNVGEEITMRLMRREKGSVFAMAKTHWKDRKGELLRLDDAVEDTCFSKLLTASSEQVHELVISKERTALQAALSADMNCPQSCFIEAALQLLLEREESLSEDLTAISLAEDVASLSIDNGSSEKLQLVDMNHPINLQEGRRRIAYSCAFSDEGAADQPEDVAFVENEDGVEQSSSVESVDDIEDAADVPSRQRYESTSTESIEEEATAEEATVEDLDIADVTGGASSPSDSKKNYYFYQAADGQHIYLHALSVRMLVKEYGSLEHCPDTIQGRIVEKEGLGMSEDIRRRLRYLCHLPLTCDVDVVEMILKPPFLSKATVASFAEEIEKRRLRRIKKARDERQHDRHIQEQETKKRGRYAANWKNSNGQNSG